MPPTTKPQTKKKEAEKGKAKKAVAVAAALLLLVLAVFVEAQQQQGAGVTAEQALGGFRDFLKQVVLGVRLAIAMAFWAAISIIVAHFAIGKISPTRFQRMGAFWDGLERAKDIVYGFAWLFLLIFSIYAAIGIIANGGKMEVDTAVNVVKWIMIDPIAEVAGQLGVGG
jgi:ABC-type dipeptide/oligopeptide/nickel transport system permease subunit